MIITRTSKSCIASVTHKVLTEKHVAYATRVAFATCVAYATYITNEVF